VFATGGSANASAFHIEPQAAHPGAGVLAVGDIWIKDDVLYVETSVGTKTVAWV
jgi:hypothetical protein